MLLILKHILECLQKAPSYIHGKRCSCQVGLDSKIVKERESGGTMWSDKKTKLLACIASKKSA